MLKPRHNNKAALLSYVFSVFLISIFILQSCNKEDDLNKLTAAKMEPSYAVPLINGEFTIDDILQNLGANDFISSDSNNLLTIIYRASLFKISAGTLITIPATNFTTELELLEDFTIEDFGFVTAISLGSILPGADSLNGVRAPFPEIGPQAGSAIPISMAEGFESVTFKSGQLSCQVVNDFPTDIIALQLDITNQSGSSVGSFTFSNIPPGGSQTSNIDLANKTLEKDIDVDIVSMHLDSVGDPIDKLPFPDTLTWIIIDTSDVITMNINASNMEISTGNVVIPTQIIQGSEEMDMVMEDSTILLYDVTLKDGAINYTISSDIRQDITLVLDMPYITKSGSNLKENITLDYTSTVPVVVSGSIDLTDYKIDFTENGVDTNTVVVNYTASIISDGQAVPISTADKFSMTFSLDNVDFSVATGYFGQSAFDLGKDTVSLNLYDNYEFGEIDLEDPKIRMNVTSSYGFPMRATFNSLFASKTSTGDTINITGIQNPLDFRYPKSVGDTAITRIEFGKAFSNVFDLISLPANQIVYDLSAVGNPDGLDPDVFNFIVDTSSFDIDIDVELKLFGKIGVFVVENMYDLDLETSGYDEIKEIEFRASFENGFPLDVDVQIYFADSLGPDSIIRIDSLIKDKSAGKLIASAEVDANGDVTEKTKSTTSIIFDNDGFEKINNMTNPKMILKATLNSAENGAVAVKLYSHYGLKMQVGVRVDLVVGFDSGGG